MEFIIYLFVDIIIGYVLQALGCAICVFAFNKMPAAPKTLLLLTMCFTAIMFIRKLEFINYGFRLILSLILFIIVSIMVFKTSIYLTTLSVLLSTVCIMICETITVSVLYAIFDPDVIKVIMERETQTDQILASLMGVPTNFILIAIMTVVYKIIRNKAKKESVNGTADT